ncbi:MAG: hypothetical protein EBE86_004640 [Hormoscilla sp. GUM202]|nr:hypothetical protein [Hormoscilla sp. GUM202]
MSKRAIAPMCEKCHYCPKLTLRRVRILVFFDNITKMNIDQVYSDIFVRQKVYIDGS